MRIICALLLLGLVFAEAGQQQTARLFVYAQRETAVRAWQPIWCDGSLVAKIRRGTFFAINVDPGRHVFTLEKSVPAIVDVKAGDESFLRLDSKVELGQPTVLLFYNAPAKVAAIEMRFVVYIDAKQVRSGSVSRIDPRAAPEPRLKARDTEQNELQ
jgi:hypothetical protein